MDTLLQDIKFAVRMLAKAPAFAFSAILVLALGIGANTAVFSLVDAVLLRPLPFPEPQQLVWVRLADPQTDMHGAFGTADFLAFRDQQKSFADVAAYAGGQEFSFNNGGEPQRITGVAVTSGFFATLGVAPERGRGFVRDDERAEAPPVVVVSHEFWQRQLAADPQIIGRSVMINARAYTVVGVMPAGLRYPSNRPNDVWPMLRFQPPRGRPPYWLGAFGRLKTGVTNQQAADELSAIAKRVEQQYPSSSSWVGRVQPLKDVLTGRVRPLLWMLLAAVTFVLLIAIANVANLLLARATAREKEIGIRLALGATRARIIRQLVTESVLLATIGGGLGVLLAVWAQQAFLAFQNVVRINLAYNIGVDSRVLLFTLVVSIVAGVLFGLAPALHGGRGPLHDILKDSVRTTASGHGNLLRRVLVAGEFALALVLVAGAALLIRSFVRLQQVDTGFRPDRIVTAQVTLPPALYRDNKAIAAFWDEFLRRARAVPGVESVSVTMSAPPDRLALTNPFTAEGQTYDKSRPLQLAEETTVGPAYFATLGVPLLNGRDFTDADAASKLNPVIINRTLAEKYFPGQDPVGRHLQTGDPRPEPPDETIIGVVGDVKYSGLDSPPAAQAYKLYSDSGWAWFSRSLFVVVRTHGDATSVVNGIRQQLVAQDRNLPLANVATMNELLGESVGQQRFRTLLLGSFAGFALLLACFGVYAVMSYTVGQRTREIGIRMALGARRSEIVRLVLGQALMLCGIGMIVGVVAALLLTRTLRSLLFAVTPNDPVSFAVAVILMASVAVLASYVPARRATKVDPMVALRYE